MKVDVFLGVPVVEVLLHDGGLPVDDREHEGRQAGSCWEGQKFSSLQQAKTMKCQELYRLIMTMIVAGKELTLYIGINKKFLHWHRGRML